MKRGLSFSNIEAWKPTTLLQKLQTNYFKLADSNQVFKNTIILQNILHDCL